MDARRTLALPLIVAGISAFLFLPFASPAGFSVFTVLGPVCVFAGVGLLLYAASRERGGNTKPGTVSRQAVATLLTVLALTLALVLYRALGG